MKFYNREKELKILRDAPQAAKQVGAQLTVLIGRRRIGKTELLKKVFDKKSKSIYFFVSSKRSFNLLMEFASIFNERTKQRLSFTDWDHFIATIFDYSIANGTTIIFDEFQNFKIVDPAVFSIMQKNWDARHKEKKLNVIVAGSLMSLLEKIFYSEKEPLYKRATRKITLEEFTFPIVKQILKDHHPVKSIRELLYFYGIFGGSPYYYYQIYKSTLFNKDLKYIIEELILDNNSILQNEGREILISEFGSEHNTYFAVLEAISLGKQTFTKIRNYTKIADSVLSRSLNDLIRKYRLISKLTPVFPNNQNIFKYHFTNNFLRFWFKYIYVQQSYIISNKTTIVLKSILANLDTMAGKEFEKYCLAYMLNLSEEESVIYPINKFGRWWNKVSEIDLIVANSKTKIALVGECKLSQKSLNNKVIEDLKNKASMIDTLKHYDIRYAIFCSENVPKSQRKLFPKDVLVFDASKLKKFCN